MDRTPADWHRPTLLLVDDETAVRQTMLRTLERESCRVVQAASAVEAMQVLKETPVHVVLSDHNMPGLTGLELLRFIKNSFPEIVRVIITASNDFDMAVQAINLGEVSRFVRKPWVDGELCSVIRQCFEQAALVREVGKLRALARKQSAEMQELEQRHPGILDVRRDSSGAILLDVDPVNAIDIWSD